MKKPTSIYLEKGRFTMIDVAKRASEDGFIKSLVHHYGPLKGNAEKFYRHTFNHVLNIKKTPAPKWERQLSIICGGFDFFEYRSKGKHVKESDRHYSISMTGHYSLSFQPWNKLCNQKVERETLRRYHPDDIMAHFIWEITWYGTEAEIAEKWKDLENTIKEFKKSKTYKDLQKKKK